MILLLFFIFIACTTHIQYIQFVDTNRILIRIHK